MLGKTGIAVSRLCFGTLAMSSSQAGLSPEEGGELIAYAAGGGVDFIDTAELYGTYAHVRHARRLAAVPLVISTKSYAFDKQGARDSVEKARRELDTDVIDLFMLHEQESTMTMIGHREAFDYYLSMKAKGIIRAVGLSTHAIEPVEAAAQAKRGDRSGWWREFDPGCYREIDVVHPLLNFSGIGILDGSAERMRAAVEDAHRAGVGILGMKMLGGGNLFNDFNKAVLYALSIDAADAYAVGMQNKNEIDMNIALFEGRTVRPGQLAAAKARTRRLHIDEWCSGCGSCVERCQSGALSVVKGKARCDPDKCVLCSYCAKVCRDFAIKVI